MEVGTGTCNGRVLLAPLPKLWRIPALRSGRQHSRRCGSPESHARYPAIAEAKCSITQGPLYLQSRLRTFAVSTWIAPEGELDLCQVVP